MAATIRLAQESDAESIARIYAPYVIDSPVSFELEPPDATEMARRIVSTLALHPWLVCEADGEVSGYVYASSHRSRAAYCWAVDVSVYTGTTHRRCGMATALYTSLFACLRLQNIYRAHAGITLPNPASVGLHEALGFQLVGVYPAVGYKSGKWHDVGWWHLALMPPDLEPTEPLSLQGASALPEWDSAVTAGLPLLRL